MENKFIKHVIPSSIQANKDKDHSNGKIYELYGKLNTDLSN